MLSQATRSVTSTLFPLRTSSTRSMLVSAMPTRPFALQLRGPEKILVWLKMRKSQCSWGLQHWRDTVALPVDTSRIICTNLPRIPRTPRATSHLEFPMVRVTTTLTTTKVPSRAISPRNTFLLMLQHVPATLVPSEEVRISAVTPASQMSISLRSQRSSVNLTSNHCHLRLNLLIPLLWNLVLLELVQISSQTFLQFQNSSSLLFSDLSATTPRQAAWLWMSGRVTSIGRFWASQLR